MGRILGNTIAAVDGEAGHHTRTCIERVARVAEDTQDTVAAQSRTFNAAYSGVLTVQIDDTPTFQTWTFLNGLLVEVE